MNETLRELRIANRYSQELLAKVLGVSRQAYMKYESGDVEPPVSVVRKLCKIYHVSYETILGKLDFQENNYDIPDDGYSMCASPSASYSVGSSTEQNFQKVVYMMEKTIASMQNFIQNNGKPVLSKSRFFNKDEFFAQVGKLHIDSTDIIQNRSESLL